MKHGLGLAFALLVVVGASGCSIIDRLFLLNADGPHGHHAGGHAGCEQGVCGPGGCEDGACQGGACQECVSGDCHTDRYGGLARHHLSPEERAALEASDYGATTPAGPPTGTVAYPYYTTRGPRDFLAKKPPSIGP